MKLTHTLRMLACSMALACLLPAAAETSLGVQAGYVTKNESAIGGLHFDHSFLPFLRVAIEGQYAFKHGGKDAFDFNLNAEAPVGFGRWRVYPIAGVGVWSWSHSQPHDSDDSNSRKTKISCNLGAGFDYRVTPSLRLSLRGTGAIMSRHYTAGVFTVGIGYVF